jgi:hypothetical protein
MTITKFYLDRARYKAVDHLGRVIEVDIDYWKGSYRVSKKDCILERTARDMLGRKHKVNFVHKLLK